MRNEANEYLFAAHDAPGKQRLMSEALKLFAGSGLDGTSIRDIGKAAGMTNPALYRHFASKDALALHLFVVCYRELWGRLRAAIDAEAEFEDRLGAFVSDFIAYHDQRPEAVLYIAETIHRFWPRVPPEMATRSVTLLAQELVAQGLAEGAISAGVSEPVRVLGVVGQLFQIARMIHLELIPGPAARWTDDLHRQIRATLR